jgi:phosphoglycolate phosphatase-like HAD superfamily hydrolase
VFVDLAIFDVDGTLTATNDVDSECFIQAIADVLGIFEPDTDWSHYEESTDPGITTQLLMQRFGGLPDPAKLLAVHDQFIQLLKDRLLAAPECYEEVPGAGIALYRLRNERGWAIAIASGAWSRSGRLKLQSAGISPEAFPSVFADEAISREAIIQLAISRALSRYQQTDFGRIVSIGDGAWDVRSAFKLGLPFLGIASGADRDRLIKEGASHVISDFVDFDVVLRCLGEARVPSLPAML